MTEDTRRDAALINDLARAFLNDTEGQVFNDDALNPFIENALALHPLASDRRLAAITARCAMDSHSWHKGARGIRESIEAGLL